MYFIVSWMSHVFYCFLFLCILFFMISTVWDLHLDQYQAELMIYKAKRGQSYWFTGQNEKFTLPFVLYTKWEEKQSNFFGWPLVANLVSNIRKTSKKKVTKRRDWQRGGLACAAKFVEGGSKPPPPVESGGLKSLISLLIYEMQLWALFYTLSQTMIACRAMQLRFFCVCKQR